MSIEVRIPKEITEYKEKILFGMSLRQLVCVTAALSIGIPSYIISNKYFGQDIASYVVIFEGIPIFAIGFVKKNNFTFAKYCKLIFKHMLKNSKRTYTNNLLIDEIFLKKGGEKNDKFNKKIKKRKRTKREYTAFKITKKARKRKGKEARREIKKARRACKQKK